MAATNLATKEAPRTGAREPYVLVRVADFSEKPGARYRTDGAYSGQEFRDDVLLPAFEAALQAGSSVLVDLDDTYSCATSFLEEAFGGLTRAVGDPEVVRKHLRIKSDEEPYLADLAWGYVGSGLKPKR